MGDSMLCYPKMYKKDIFCINYDKLKENSIKCLVFDLGLHLYCTLLDIVKY